LGEWEKRPDCAAILGETKFGNKNLTSLTAKSVFHVVYVVRCFGCKVVDDHVLVHVGLGVIGHSEERRR
jgi:hypothetical protein